MRQKTWSSTQWWCRYAQTSARPPARSRHLAAGKEARLPPPGPRARVAEVQPRSRWTGGRVVRQRERPHRLLEHRAHTPSPAPRRPQRTAPDQDQQRRREGCPPLPHHLVCVEKFTLPYLAYPRSLPSLPPSRNAQRGGTRAGMPHASDGMPTGTRAQGSKGLPARVGQARGALGEASASVHRQRGLNPAALEAAGNVRTKDQLRPCRLVVEQEEPQPRECHSADGAARRAVCSVAGWSI